MSYRAVHTQLQKTRGSAKAYNCECGQPADQWAYVGPREGGERRPYSADLSLYEPMCTVCHRKYDTALIKVTDKWPGDVTLW